MRTPVSLLFILALAYWLRPEFKSKTSLKEHWKWLLAAAITQIVATYLSVHSVNYSVGNILEHTIGGGITSALFYYYLSKTLEIKLNWKMGLLALLAFVATLGTLNELYEYVFELMHWGTFSFDSHDTWRDMASNTTGALIAWILISTYCTIKNKVRINDRKKG